MSKLFFLVAIELNTARNEKEHTRKERARQREGSKKTQWKRINSRVDSLCAQVAKLIELTPELILLELHVEQM